MMMIITAFQNVVGMKDKDITTEIETGGNVITVTIIPSYIYDHMVKKYVFCRACIRPKLKFYCFTSDISKELRN